MLLSEADGQIKSPVRGVPETLTTNNIDLIGIV